MNKSRVILIYYQEEASLRQPLIRIVGLVRISGCNIVSKDKVTMIVLYNINVAHLDLRANHS